MAKKNLSFLLLLFSLSKLPSVSSFAVLAHHRHHHGRNDGVPFFRQAESSDEVGENDGLILNDVDSQMARLRSKYPTSEADYLALARARNAAKAESVNEGAKDSDWHQAAADARQQQGMVDDWENAAGEAGNVESQILIPVDLIPGEGSPGDSDDQPEPKLLLF